jgi:hypothetical protein
MGSIDSFTEHLDSARNAVIDMAESVVEKAPELFNLTASDIQSAGTRSKEKARKATKKAARGVNAHIQGAITQGDHLIDALPSNADVRRALTEAVQQSRALRPAPRRRHWRKVSLLVVLGLGGGYLFYRNRQSGGYGSVQESDEDSFNHSGAPTKGPETNGLQLLEPEAAKAEAEAEAEAQDAEAST